MKHLIKFLFLSSIISIPSLLHAAQINDNRDNTYGRSFFHARSGNKAQESAGLGELMTWGYDECSNGLTWVTAEYAKSFDRSGVGKYIFFNGTDVMFTGTAGGPGVDVFGENFLVNDNFSGAIRAHPRVKSGLVEINFFWDFDIFDQGFYFIAHVPYVYTQWAVNFEEQIITAGTIITANILGNPTATAAPFNSMIEAWNGQETFFDVTQPLQFARVNGKQQKSLLADPELALGYIILNDDENFFSVNVRGIIPTGNRPQALYLFEPIVGNTHCGELGAGILANFMLWQGSCNDALTIFINANIYTMFKTRQMRTFDLTVNGIGSRYLLFKKFVNGVYAGEIVRGPNILTLPIYAKNNVHADSLFMLEYLRAGFVFDIGYNLWGRTRDHIEIIGTIPENTYGVAGLSGTGANAQLTASTTQISGANASLLDPTAVYISNTDINVRSAAHPGAFSHGIFFHANYIFDTRYVQPFLGVGTEVEFSGTNKAFKMGHFWFKTGFCF